MEKDVKNMGKDNVKKVFNLVIVDESGSMSIIQREALAGINETIETCRKLQETHQEMEQMMTLITFDSGHFKVHFDNANVKEIRKLNPNEYRPGGATPLYDAIGKGIAMLNAQTSADDNVLVTIITDGEENCSSEYNLGMVKNLIEKQKKLGWTFTLIGTDNLDVEGMAGSMAIDNHLVFAENEVETKAMFARERKSRARYCNFIACNEAMPSGSYFDEE
ncbi:MAG: VWA domain-containing protein [Bacteroidia bacterium]|nr:VWA domain-containing protein [Bacteroidia bacterium]